MLLRAAKGRSHSSNGAAVRLRITSDNASCARRSVAPTASTTGHLLVGEWKQGREQESIVAIAGDLLATPERELARAIWNGRVEERRGPEFAKIDADIDAVEWAAGTAQSVAGVLAHTEAELGDAPRPHTAGEIAARMRAEAEAAAASPTPEPTRVAAPPSLQQIAEDFQARRARTA